MKRAFLLIVIPALLAGLGFAQTPAASINTDQTNIKGCLGRSDGSYTVVEDNTGRIFKITTSSVDLKAHLSQDVTLVGHGASGTSSAAADGSFTVTELNMISEHCAGDAAVPAATVVTPGAAATPPAETTVTPGAAATPPAETAATPAAAATPPAETDVTHAADATAPAATVSTPAQTANTPPAAAVAPAAATSTVPENAIPPAAAATPPAETASTHAAHPRRRSATRAAVVTPSAETASSSSEAGTPAAAAATTTAPASTSSATGSTPDAGAATPAVPAKHGSLWLLIAIGVLVLAISMLFPFLSKWRKRKMLERTGAPNLSLTREVSSVENKSDKPDVRKAA